MLKLFTKKIKYFLIFIFLLSINSCSYVNYQPIVKGMTTRIPPNINQSNTTSNSLFKDSTHINYSYKPLFEDYHPHNVGDLLTILLQEDIRASNSSSAHTNRNGTNNIGLSLVPGQFDPIFGLHIDDVKISLDSAGKHEFSGKGNNSANNTFNGLITVTVQNILPNGNFKIIGEKQVAINEGIEFIRFSGVVNPQNIHQNNIVVSTEVADAKIEYFSQGRIHDIQKMGWLQKLLLNLSFI